MDLNWYVLQTKPKQEDRVEAWLNFAKIEVFNPKIQEVRLINGKKKKIAVPLFPCYVFAKLHPGLFDIVVYTRGVRKILGINGRPKPIKESIIETIRERLNGDAHIYMSESYFDSVAVKPGDYVLVVDGPLKGFIGIVDKVNSLKSIVILISMDYQVKAEVHNFLLKKIEPDVLE